MTRETFISVCNRKEKLVRNEVGYSQQKMSEVLGLSKKTLVEIEKWRCSLGWQGAVTLCVLFAHTQEITLAFGEDIAAFLASIGGEGMRAPFETPYAIWRTVLTQGDEEIEQNSASQLYRLRRSGKTILSSFTLSDLRERMQDQNKGV